MSNSTFEIERYETEIVVGPYTSHEPFRLGPTTVIRACRGEEHKYEGASRAVYTESVGKINRKVTFAEDNRCKNHFEIRYGTRMGGSIVVRHDIENMVQGKNLEDFWLNASEYSLEFIPPSEPPWPFLDLTNYKGFDRGNRYVHFHLSDPKRKEFGIKRNYRRMTYVLDLTAYQKDEETSRFGHNANSLPRLWHDPREDEADCKNRHRWILGNPNEFQRYLKVPKQTSYPDKWIWTWELNDITDGFTDIIWQDFLIPPYDVFISHASEDKQIVRELVKKLKAAGLIPWYDKDEMMIGDDLRQNIVRGIGFSRTGVVVLSRHFFDREKIWTKNELELLSTDKGDGKVILPIRHGMSVDELRKENSKLAELVVATTEDGIERVAEQIVRAVKRTKREF